MIDYLVVGLGLAGMAFCETLQKNNKSFTVFNDSSQTSSMVAGGLYNPVILKRFTLSWKATEQLEISNDFYATLQEKLQVQFDFELPVLRRFASVEEQNLWFEACDKPCLQAYLLAEVIPNQNAEISAPYNLGKVLQTGRLDTKLLLNTYQQYLGKDSLIQLESVEYQKLEIQEKYVQYAGIKAKNIVFAEGFGLLQNPFFNYLPMQGSKGEYLIIKSEELKEKKVIKSSVFIIPLGNDLYKVGANYNRNDKSNIPTLDAKNELLRKLESFMECNYEVVDHVAGVRPTIKDRRPLVGTHPKYKNVSVLNGFGSHGVLIAPWAAEQLYDYIENGEPIDPEMDVERFKKDWTKG